MAYTVKQVTAISGVSVRTLHFYDETGLLKPARHAANGYRLYEEPQLLALQQILFYRELGFGLKQIRQILGRPDFEKLAALRSHREVLQADLARTRTLVETLDKTIEYLKGTRAMKTEEMFAGFSVGAGEDRFGERVTLGGERYDRKVSAQDTGGGMCVFEFGGAVCWAKHRHPDQDEWVYVIDGDFDFVVGEQRLHAGPGECVFLPRNVAHAWANADGRPGKVINVYQPAGKMEAFFAAVERFKELPTREDVINRSYTEEQVKGLHGLFEGHGMDLLGPPMGFE